uniref:Uncharacterized protein n=1 Tax=Fagus sylvatica TaxID=28930 RepID=A0A2N9GCW1_FAGSY
MLSTRGRSTTNSSNNSAETIASNEDLVAQILIRVPVKPLLRFKCVSKQWLSLISDSHFCHRHHHHTSLSTIFLRRTPSLFQFIPLHHTHHHTTPPFTSLSFINHNEKIKILQSCNGLFLCRSQIQNRDFSYYVCNPTTKHFSTLPPITTNGPISIFGVNLAFEPSKSPYYQVICVRSSDVSLYYYQIEIYSSKTRAWNPCGSPFVAPFDMVFDNGVFWNGAFHWLSPTGSALYFDIHNECLGKMPSLPVSRGNRRFRYFGESGGHLHLVEIYGPRATKFNVFEMESDYSKWFVKYEVDLDGIVATFPEMVRDYIDTCDSCYYAFVIVFIVRSENEEDSKLLLHIPGKIISYNLMDEFQEGL